ncbi:ATP-binding protein [Rheinheimera baltica]|uniref:histidine kinase n=1 Tax=Rheinheimera baltica TaxID=67576 RepID=A0ABT9HW28_9GAMM|nr:ATP-binding protein [Rheinheimera baltica]MDP5135306.1 ATP-binding protein [Rheinheimera baltica]
MWRFVLALLLVVIVGSIALGQLFDGLAQQQNEHRLSQEQQHLLSQVELIKSAIQSGIAPAQLSTWFALASQPSAVQYELQPLKDYPLPQAFIAQIYVDKAVFLESKDGLTAYALIDAQTVLLVTRAHESGTGAADNPWLLTASFYSILLGLLLIFLAPFLIRLAKLRNAAIAFGDGKLDIRLTVGSFWYLKEIEQAFNQMTERLGRSIQDNKLLAAGLSHELRTPLARVRMGLDTLCETTDPKLRTQYEVRVNQNLDDMESLINALLNFARLQHSLDSTAKSRIDLKPLVLQQMAKANDQRLELIVGPDQYWIWGDEHHVSLMLSNLLTNALKHCREKVQVTLSGSTGHVTLCINDDGTGISATDADKVFQPFVRLAEKIEGNKPGFGLGLALVERITQWLGGEVKVVTCQNLKGASFVVRFSYRPE